MTSKCSPFRWTKKLTPTQVLRLIRDEPDVRSALRLFDAATAKYPTGFRHDAATISLLSSRLASAGLFSLCFSLLSRCSSELLLPSAPEPALLSLIRTLGRAHRPLSALRLFRLAPRALQLPHSSRSYTTILSVLVSNNLVSNALSLFEDMRKSNIPPTLSTFNVLIKGLCISGSIDAAVKLFHGMPKRDTCSYNTLVDGLCKNNRIHEAKDLFRKMGDESLLPTVVTYTTLIHWSGRAGFIDDALEMFDEMGKRGIMPNVITYSSLIDSLCKAGQSAKALELLNRMAKERILPNAITYSSVTNGLCKEGRLNDAMEVFDRMRLQGKKPDAGLYGKIIMGLSDLGRVHESANYLDEMVLNSVSPNRVTWSLHVRIHNSVIVRLCGKRELTRAFKVYQSTRTRGITVEPETFLFLVECLCKQGDLERASRVVHDMLVESCFPERDTWTAIIGAYWNKKSVRDEAELTWSRVMESW